MTIDPAPGILRVQTGYESDLDNEDEFQPPLSGTLGDFDDKDFVKEKFDRDIEDAINFAQSLQTRRPSKTEKSEQLTSFVDSRKDGWADITRDRQTFLHALAYYTFHRKPVVSLQWLMSRAMLRCPHLMGQMDKWNRTPLTAALSLGNEAFSDAACHNLKPTTRQRFKSLLEIECTNPGSDRDVTCLHTALTCSFREEGQRQKIVKTMCSFVPDSMFTIKDPRGRTPLLLAVEYERIFEGQVGVVEELLRWGPQALSIPIPVSLYSNRTYSIYQYHIHTRRQAEAKRATIEEPKKKQVQVSKTEDDSARKAGPKSEKTIMGPPPLPKDRERGAAASASSHPSGSSRAAANMSAPRQDTLNPPAAHKDSERQARAEEIGNLLKRFYLRTQKPEIAAASLSEHGKSSKELWFDFGPPKRLSRSDFQKHFRHLRFDTILQYVAFPQVELDDHKQTPDPRYAGRKDMQFFFDWLRSEGVKKIIKVIVDDLRTPSHSDEAIEKSLEHFDVEILDWKRLDLDPVSLSEVGPCLREVNLYWSGRNSVLRAWSDKDGLARIPTLKIINILQTEGLESPQRTQRNFEAFEKRLHDSWPEGEPKPRVKRLQYIDGRQPARGQSDNSLPDRQEQSVDSHRWLQCMEYFADHFRQISTLRDSINDPSLEPVEVCLIDDGADITRGDLGDLKGNKFPGKSFCYYQDSWRVSPYWHSSSGHGTLMARLIHKICPSAVIHIIKLQTFPVENSNKLQIDPDSAIKAIEYAAERGAQIISMSWTIKPPEGDKKKEFDDAIHHALNNKGILMFCAASDQGKSADLTYPHGSNRTSFRIGAAKATGSMAETVGDAHELDFIFPGHQVVMNAGEDLYDSDVQKLEAHSGSSVATALAAGLAALIIECVRLGIFYTDATPQVDPSLAIRKDDLVKICKRNNMKTAMESIGTSRNTDGKYIEVWQKFDPAAEKLRQNEGSRIDQLEKIANLARHFLQKGLNYGE